MSKIIFNEHQQRVLEANPNVASVSDWAIQYTPEFKIHAVVDDYMEHYNGTRKQWNLKKMTLATIKIQPMHPRTIG